MHCNKFKQHSLQTAPSTTSKQVRFSKHASPSVEYTQDSCIPLAPLKQQQEDEHPMIVVVPKKLFVAPPVPATNTTSHGSPASGTRSQMCTTPSNATFFNAQSGTSTRNVVIERVLLVMSKSSTHPTATFNTKISTQDTLLHGQRSVGQENK